MKLKVGALLILGLLLSACSTTKNAAKSTDQAVLKGSVSASAEKMAAKPVNWEKLGEPGAQHKMLEPFVGKWSTSGKFWIEPGKPPQVSQGHSDLNWIFGKRFLKETYTGSSAGKLFNGMGLIGFDNIKGKFTSMWVDSMATSMMTSEGEFDPSGKTCTLFGTYDDPVSGTEHKTRTTVQIVGNDKRIVEMYELSPDSGKESKVYEITYTRAGHAATAAKAPAAKVLAEKITAPKHKK